MRCRQRWATVVLAGVTVAGAVRAQAIRLSAGAGFSDVSGFVASEDGQHVVYRQDAEADEANELFSVRLPAGAPIRLSGIIPVGSWVDLETITPDGSRVVFRSDQDTPGVFELYSVPIEGPAGAAVRLNPDLVANGDVDFFRLSPDGTRVVYRAYQRFADVIELFSVPVLGPSTSAVRISGSMTAGGNVSGLWISPDSTRVIYRADQQTDETYELYSVPIAGPPASAVKLNPTPVAGGDVDALHFFIAPDGSRVVFQADLDIDGVSELYSVPIGGPAASAVKLNPAFTLGHDVTRFRIAPDSSRVVYLADQVANERFELFSVPVAGPAGVATGVNPALLPGRDVVDFAISPDASRVVYEADQLTDEVFELFSVPIAGPSSASERISGDLVAGGDVTAFSISSDSQWAVYLADQELDTWPTGHRAPLAGPEGNDELLWIAALALGPFDFQIFADASQVMVRGAPAQGAGIERLWTFPLAGPPDVNGVDWLFGRFQPNGDCAALPFPRLLPGDLGILYVADQDIDEQFELYVLYFPVFGDDFEAGDTSHWSATVP